MEIIPVVDEGLGNSSYLVGLGDGSALVVDPFRNPEPYLAGAELRGWHVRYAVETHLHADFVSGSRELATEGAQVVASAGAPLAFPAVLLGDGDELDLAGLTLRALATPGHTPEHLSYLLLDGAEPKAVFTGGTLIVGGAARPDLLGPEHTEPLARATFRSVQALMALPGDLEVYPTHGPGSFCSAGSGKERVSTITAERAGNPLLQARDEDEFVQRLLGGLGSYPPYFLELREVNRSGPRVYGAGGADLPALSVSAVKELVADGAELVDARGIAAFSAAHVPGSVSIPMRAEFATWLGWLVGRDRPIVLVADESLDRRQLVWACLGIGFDQVAGELAGGVAAWQQAGEPVASIPLLDPSQLGEGTCLLDIRQDSEWDEGHLPGAVHLELGDLARHPGELTPQPVATHCGHGERAMTAASLLSRAGHDDVSAIVGGPEDIAEATGQALERRA